MKVLGTGWGNGVNFADIEVINDQLGKPTIVLSGHAAELASQLNICGWMLSLSHTATTAGAMVTALSARPHEQA